jgi:hypothetical protein
VHRHSTYSYPLASDLGSGNQLTTSGPSLAGSEVRQQAGQVRENSAMKPDFVGHFGGVRARSRKPFLSSTYLYKHNKTHKDEHSRCKNKTKNFNGNCIYGRIINVHAD